VNVRVARAVAQVVLGVLLGAAGVAHLTWLREQFQALVPSWLPLDPDLVVVSSGIVEIGVGSGLLLLWRQPVRARVGMVAALLLLAVFPGNISQYVEQRDAFGLDTDAQRAARLAFQPLLVVWAIVATDARRTLRPSRDDAIPPRDTAPRNEHWSERG
jgi:uncharacterized membrane protein